MFIRSIRHKGLKRLVEEGNPRGIRPELVNRVRNILTVLILADSISDFINTAPSGWRVPSAVRRPQRYVEHLNNRELADHF